MLKRPDWQALQRQTARKPTQLSLHLVPKARRHV